MTTIEDVECVPVLDTARIEHGTAVVFQKLAAQRGISSHIVWKDNQYWANDTPCGKSVHGLYEWLNNQPGVLP